MRGAAWVVGAFVLLVASAGCGGSPSQDAAEVVTGTTSADEETAAPSSAATTAAPSGPDPDVANGVLVDLMLGEETGLEPWILDKDDHRQFLMSSWCPARSPSESLEVAGVQRVYVDDADDPYLFLTERRSVYSGDGVQQLLAEVTAVPDRCSGLDNSDSTAFTWRLVDDTLSPDLPPGSVALEGDATSGWVTALLVMPVAERYAVVVQGNGADPSVVASSTLVAALLAASQAERDLAALRAVGAL